jgi:hypothetical protein
MRFKKYISLYLLFLVHLPCYSQNLKDTCISIPLTGLHFSGQLAFQDLATRYGNTANVGIPFLYKTSKNWLIGIEGNYFFGTKINEENHLSNLKNSEGVITANDGAPGRLRLTERGLNFYLTIGKILPFFNVNKNCGPLVWAGAGYMQHKINIYDIGKNIPQLSGDLINGYDRLTGGFSFTGFLGYLYLSKNKLANFYAGFEFNYGFTKSLRVYQFDTMKKDNFNRQDTQLGFRVGWILPLYKRIKEFYYY